MLAHQKTHELSGRESQWFVSIPCQTAIGLFESSTDPTETTTERQVSSIEEKHDSCPAVHQDWKLAIRMDARDMLARYAEHDNTWQTRLLQNVCKRQCVLAAICTGHNLDSSKLHSLVAFAKRYGVHLSSCQPCCARCDELKNTRSTADIYASKPGPAPRSEEYFETIILTVNHWNLCRIHACLVAGCSNRTLSKALYDGTANCLR